MKRFLEMRGADGGRWRRICALPAFWTGLLYDQTSLDAAWDLVKDWTRRGAPGTARSGAEDGAAHALPPDDRAGGGPRKSLAIAQAGLQRRAFANAKGADERIFLEPVEAILREGMHAGRGDPAALRARLGPPHRPAVQRLRLLSGRRGIFRVVPQPSRHRLREILSVARSPSCPSSGKAVSTPDLLTKQ